jgi:hypothetical protein
MDPVTISRFTAFSMPGSAAINGRFGKWSDRKYTT